MKIYSVIVKKSQFSFINYLIENKFDINTTDNNGHTLIYYALIYYQEDIERYLYRHGALIKISNSEMNNIIDII
jgi:ankyrin repeat protein